MLRITLTALALGFLYAGSAFAQKGLAPDDTVTTLLKIERIRNQAVQQHNSQLLDRLYAEDFIGISSKGAQLNKPRQLRLLSGIRAGVSYDLTGMEVKSYGRSAVVTGRINTLNDRGEITNATAFLHIFERREGRWQLVRAQATPVADPEN